MFGDLYIRMKRRNMNLKYVLTSSGSGRLVNAVSTEKFSQGYSSFLPNVKLELDNGEKIRFGRMFFMGIPPYVLHFFIFTDTLALIMFLSKV